MSEIKKYLSLEGLGQYHDLITKYIDAADGKLETDLKGLQNLIEELEAKLGNWGGDNSDSDFVSVESAIVEINNLINEIRKEGGEIDTKIVNAINEIVGDLKEGESPLTLVQIAERFEGLGDVYAPKSEFEEVQKKVDEITSTGGEPNVQADWNTADEDADSFIKNKPDLSVYATTEAVGNITDALESLKGDNETVVDAVNKIAADAASTAEQNAKDYADGVAATAEQNAKDYADSLAGNYDSVGSAATAEQNAKDYADGLAGNYDAAGSAAAAETAAKAYADSLATNYDAAGSAAGAQAAAEATAKAYADSLIADEEGNSKFDAAGSAEAAQSAAIAHANEVAGANTELINGLSDRIGSLEGISQAANVVYNEETKYINIVDKDGNVIGAGFDASPFIVDGMLDGVAFEEVEGVKTNNLVFTFNTAAGKENVVVDFTKYVDIYQGDGSSIELNSETKTFSVKEVDASKTKLSTSIEVNGGPLADDANDNWPWTEGGKKVIPAGKTMEEILTSLFLKVTNGTVTKGSITWNPSLSAPSVSITQSGTVEVGTKLTATANTTNTVSSNTRSCTFTCKPGHFLSTGTDEEGKLIFGSYVSGNKTVYANAVEPATEGTPSIKTYWNGKEVTNVNGTTEYTVSVEGTNTFKVDQSGVKAYAGAIDNITVYGATNTKVPVETVKASISGDTAPAAKDLTSTNSATVKGARAYWMGCMASPLAEFTNATIREAGEDSDSGLVKTLGSSPATTLEVPAGSYDVVIITQKEVTSVISKAQGNFEIGGNFTKNHQEVNVEGANGFTAIKYHVYHCNADWDKDTLTISYK